MQYKEGEYSVAEYFFESSPLIGEWERCETIYPDIESAICVVDNSVSKYKAGNVLRVTGDDMRVYYTRNITSGGMRHFEMGDHIVVSGVTSINENLKSAWIEGKITVIDLDQLLIEVSKTSSDLLALAGRCIKPKDVFTVTEITYARDQTS
jgi:uridine phosphorylase